MPNIFTHQFSFNELAISRLQIEHVMGYEPDTIPEPFPEMIDEVLSVAANYCNIQGGYLLSSDISFDSDLRLLNVGKVSLDIHKIIFHQIKNAEQLGLFVCTAGPNIGEWSKRLMADGDMMKGYIVDVVGSEIVEKAMDKIQETLTNQMTKNGLKITNRYSPGYCSWNVAEQHKLFSLLPQNFCGIRLTDTALMYPIKSISGIIGIGKNVRLNPYTCQICDMQNCLYRNRKS